MNTAFEDSINSTGQNNKRSNGLLAALLAPFKWLIRHPKLVIFTVLALLFLSWWTTKDAATTQAKPLLTTVDRGDIEDAVTAAGNLQPSNYVDVGAQVSGQLEKLHVEVGDKVSVGQLLAEIDASVQINRVDASRASLDALEAQLSARNASLKLAQANADRQTRLIEEDATSQADFDSAINTLASAQSSLIQLQSQIAQSKASLASDEATLAFSKIAAPMEGTVISINQTEGQTLNASQQAPTILRIADLSTMTVQGEVSEADVSKLKQGMEVYFTTLGGGARRWYGTLRQILPKPTVANNVVLYTALFDVENTDNTLLSDMTAQIFFVTASARDVIRVPVAALNFRDFNNLLGLDLNNDASGQIASNEANDQPQRTNTPDAGGAQGMGGGQGMGTGGGMGNFADLSPEETEELRARRGAEGGGRGGGGGRQQTATNSNGAPTQATVIVASEDGSFEQREITVGVTTRVAGEILRGLNEGDQVVAGIIQASAAGGNNNQNNNFGGGGGFGDGGGGMGGGR